MKFHLKLKRIPFSHFPFFSLFLLLGWTDLGAYVESKTVPVIGKMSGRISRISLSAELVRVRLQTQNIKFLNKLDKLSLWGPENEVRKCHAKVLGKSSAYLILNITNMAKCLKEVNLVVGGVVYLYGEDFEKKVHVAQEVVEILLKKKLAMEGKIHKDEKDLERYYDQIESINVRYEVLLKQMKNEWEQELRNLEQDKLTLEKNLNLNKIKRDDIIYSLEKYRISNDNLTLDRWSLDSQLYFKK